MPEYQKRDIPKSLSARAGVVRVPKGQEKAGPGETKDTGPN